MATIGGQRITYGFNQSATTYDGPNEKLDISPMLDILRPTDVPLLTLIGRDSLRTPCTQVKHEWMEDEIRGMTTVTSGLNNTTDPVTVTLTTAAHAAYFRGTNGTGSPKDYSTASVSPGDIVRIWDANGEEIAIVTDATSTTIDLDRSQLGSTPASHTTSCNVTIIGTLQPQGLTTVGASRTTIKAVNFNYTQIFEDSFRASATQKSTAKITNGDDMAFQVQNIVEVMGVQMERSLIFGKKQKPLASVTGQQGPAGAFGGIRSFISTNVYDKSGAALTQAMVEDALQDVWTAGAKSTHLVCNATQKRRINTFLDAYRQAGYNDTRLGTTVTRYETDFGEVNVLLDRHMPTNEVLIIDSSKIGLGPLSGRGLSWSKRPVESGEADLHQFVGEYTCEVRTEKAHARIYNLATANLF